MRAGQTLLQKDVKAQCVEKVVAVQRWRLGMLQRINLQGLQPLIVVLKTHSCVEKEKIRYAALTSLSVDTVAMKMFALHFKTCRGR